jgi:hypothetical protein
LGVTENKLGVIAVELVHKMLAGKESIDWRVVWMGEHKDSGKCSVPIVQLPAVAPFITPCDMYCEQAVTAQQHVIHAADTARCANSPGTPSILPHLR